MSIEINYENNNVNEVQSLINQTENDFNLLDKFSSYTRLICVIAWIQRFLTNARTHEKIQVSLNTTELNKAFKIVVKLVQKSAFSTEVNIIQQKKALHKSNKLIQLNVFLDEDCVLQVGG